MFIKVYDLPKNTPLALRGVATGCACVCGGGGVCGVGGVVCGGCHTPPKFKNGENSGKLRENSGKLRENSVTSGNICGC